MTELIIHPLTPNSEYNLDKKSAQGKQSDAASAGENTTFGDMLEMFNPLQHLPVISHFYRAESGNNIPAAAKIVGAGLLGGVVGAVGSAAVSLIEAVSGEPILQMSMLGDGADDAQHQPFAAGSMNVAALTPHSGEEYLANIYNGDISLDIAQNNKAVLAQINESNQSSSYIIDNSSDLRNPQNLSQGLGDLRKSQNLGDLRKSQIGLPQSSIEAQLKNNLSDMIN